MRESKSICGLGKIISIAGLTLLGISGFLNINNLDKKGTPEYSLSYRNKTLYSMAIGGVMILGGISLIEYSIKRRD